MADLEAEITGRVEESKTKRTRLSTEELAAAEAAVLAADGRDVSEIVTHYLSLESRVRSKNIDLNAALSFVESHYRSEIQTASVLTAYNEFVEGGAGWSGNVIIHCCNASCFLPPRSFANAATPHRPILCQHADAGDRPGDYEYRQSILCP